MTPHLIFFPLLFVITLVNSEASENGTNCDGFQANFNMKDVIGEWHVVALIPTKAFDNKEMTCCKVEIRETDGAGLRWLINKTVESPKKLLPEDTSGIIIRMRYHTEHPFDIWSKSVEDINGCFQLVVSLDIGNKDLHDALRHDAIMQLHLLELEDPEDPFLIHILWGRLISVVVFRRKQGVTLDELEPISEFVNKLRGPQERSLKQCFSPP